MKPVDVAIIGSGFAGSILARILSKGGRRVALIDSASHPRFAIGESSTPIADIILRRLGKAHQLDDLIELSTWGGWQKSHRDLTCGRKRGFSYYRHSRNENFQEFELGDQSLLVAASASDQLADTHWFRSEVDEYFFCKAIEAGALDLSNHNVVQCTRRSDGRPELLCQGARQESLVSDWVIDASGQSGVLARMIGAVDRTDQLATCTRSVYGHYRDVSSWTQHLDDRGSDLSRDPFNADDAAQHHLAGSGWMWMLRFGNGVTSVGYTAPMHESLDWTEFPSLSSLMQRAELIAPKQEPRTTARLQRLFDPVLAPNLLAMPTAAVTIDPLHSTGIAHALAGVERIITILHEENATGRAELIDGYRSAVLNEAFFLDQLVSTAYATMSDFSRFTAACMLYFAGAIRCEERLQQGETPAELWNADDSEYRRFVSRACQALVDPKLDPIDEIRQGIQPWNTAGLMDDTVNNRYAYTATK